MLQITRLNFDFMRQNCLGKLLKHNFVRKIKVFNLKIHSKV